jgi:hypothetical protein
MRKIIIGIVSFAVVLGLFVLYSRIDRTPPLNTNTGKGFVSETSDGNSSSLQGNIGKVSTSTGDIGIGTAEKFSYITRNDKGEIEREFGFQKLLHTEGDIWELEKPYMHLYRQEFTCYMKADNGIVKVEKVGDKTMPKDATFRGNVVINILPGKSQSIQESTIYLDNLAFLSERSQLSTTSNLRFVSKTAQLSGAGLELIYNDDLERLEIFKIVDLDELKVKIKRSTLGTIRQDNQSPSDNAASSTDESREPAAVAADSEKSVESEEKYYTCIFSRNVLIETPEQRVYAAQEIEIDDIIWPHDIKDENEPDKVISNNEPNSPDSIAAEPNNPETVPEDLVDVVITCDNGFIIAPKGSGKINEFQSAASAFPVEEKPAFEDNTEKNTLITKRIQLTTLEGDSIAEGSTELVFYIEDMNNSDPNLRSFPVTINSQNGAKFIKSANQVIFEGNSLCRIPQNDLTEKRDATLASQMLIINLPKSQSERSLSDIIAIGPTELLFYVEDSNAATEQQKIIPVKITAQEKTLYLPAMNQLIFDKDCFCQIGSEETGKEQLVSLRSSNLKVDLIKDKSAQSFAFSDITAAGPVDLNFFMKDPNNMGTRQSLLPVNITAKKYARYVSSSGKIIVDGSCKSSMLREDTDFVQELVLLSDKITVDLPEDVNEQSPTSSLTQIRHLNADSNQVTLTVTKKAKNPEIIKQTGEKVLGGSELICRSLDYDTQEQIFTATGPGWLTLSDIEISDSNESIGSKILGKKWWAVMDGFSDLKYQLNNNRIIADSEPGKTINIQYIEEKETKEHSPVIMATAGHIEIQMTETDDGKLEPSIVVASGGIDYKKDQDNRFLGSVLVYDHTKSTVTIQGDEKNPAYYNGVLVDEVFIDLKNNKIEGKISKSSSL